MGPSDTLVANRSWIERFVQMVRVGYMFQIAKSGDPW